MPRKMSPGPSDLKRVHNVEGTGDGLWKRLGRARKYLMLVALMGTWVLSCAPKETVTRIDKLSSAALEQFARNFDCGASEGRWPDVGGGGGVGGSAGRLMDGAQLSWSQHQGLAPRERERHGPSAASTARVTYFSAALQVKRSSV